MRTPTPNNDVEELAEALDLFRQLDALAKAKFLAWCEWAVSPNRDPEADPRKTDPFWADYPDAIKAA
ncbi:hypothetical protein [Bosea beijingensis]